MEFYCQIIFALVSLIAVVLVGWEKFFDLYNIFRINSKKNGVSADAGTYFSSKSNIPQQKKDSIRSVLGIGIAIIGIIGLLFCGQRLDRPLRRNNLILVVPIHYACNNISNTLRYTNSYC